LDQDKLLRKTQAKFFTIKSNLDKFCQSFQSVDKILKFFFALAVRHFIISFVSSSKNIVEKASVRFNFFSDTSLVYKFPIRNIEQKIR
jgi:hypothetical protein